MQIIEAYQDIPENMRGCVIAVGNFDGVHKGHQALLAQAAGIAQKTGKKLAVLTFEPHPKRLFRPDEPPGRVSPRDVKAWRLEACGVDVLFSVNFDWDFASQSAEDFIQNVLQAGLGASHVVVGQDFRFGQLRKGDPALIEAAGIPVTRVEPALDDSGQAYSSSRIRQALRKGDIAAANRILGWDWEVRGTVIKGDQRGRELGYPTANFMLSQTIHPAYGVYAGRVNIPGEEQWRPAAINIGIRPMFEIEEAQVESFIFDFDRDIYGATLRVQPVQLLRSEARFANVEALVRQMDEDCAQARAILGAG